MKIFKIVLFSLFFFPVYLSAQDRDLGINFIIPESFDLQNEGRFLNITKPPFNAKGDGVSDDTEAFINAYNWVYDTIGDTQGYKDPFTSVIIYIPDGTYLVSNTIIYSREIMYGYNKNSEGIHQVRFIGQSKEGTIIRLKDQAEGFAGPEPKPVISFGHMDFNNIPGSNTIRNLTINTGSGNPGASGIKMAGANNASGSNVRIVSGDGKGMIGMDFSVGTVVGWFHDFSIEGFNYGVRLVTRHFVHPILEHFSISKCSKSAILLDGLASVTMRKILGEECGQAVISNGLGTFPSIVDSKFYGNNKSIAAISLDSGYMFARNVLVKGYSGLLDYKGNSTVESNEDEVVVGGIVNSENSRAKRSLNLEIKDSPLVDYYDTTLWANVNDYGANGNDELDDSDAIQRALNSGKKVICFPNFLYTINQSVNIPEHVEALQGFYSTITGKADTKFIISGSSLHPLSIDDMDLDKGEQFRIESGRPLVFTNISTKSNLFTKEESIKDNEMFLNNTNGIRYATPFTDARIWIRFINTESRNTQYLIDNCEAVVLGYKTEKNQTSFEIKNNSKVEILGGQSNQMAWDKKLDNPAILVKDSKVALNFTVAQGWNQGFRVIVRAINNGNQTDYIRNDFPTRSIDYEVIRAVPLFLNY